MREPDRRTRSSGEAATEIRSLLDRISRLTARARSAADDGDVPALARVLDERHALFTDAAERVHQLSDLCRESSAEDAAEIASLVAGVRSAAAEVQRENDALASRVATLRGTIVRSIQRADAAHRATVAYRAAAGADVPSREPASPEGSLLIPASRP